MDGYSSMTHSTATKPLAFQETVDRGTQPQLCVGCREAQCSWSTVFPRDRYSPLWPQAPSSNKLWCTCSFLAGQTFVQGHNTGASPPQARSL